MNTDDLFYRLLKLFPQCFFELIGLPASLADRYRFDSVEVLKGGVRIDGVFQPTAAADPVYIVEVQFYRSPTFFADLFLKVFGYLKENDPAQDWRAIAVFPGRAFEPKQLTPYEMLLASPNVTRVYLDELPAHEAPTFGIGLWQLVEASEERAQKLLATLLPKARSEIKNAPLSRQMVEWIEELLIRKFVSMTREEIGVMFQLKDIRETRVYKDAREEGERIGEERGEERGEKRGEKRGEERGERETKRKLARKLLAEGMTVKKVAQLTELPLKDVRSLSDEN